MAKPSSSRDHARNAPQPPEHRYFPAVLIDDYGRARILSADAVHGFFCKKLDAASQKLQLRTERREKKARREEAREHRRAERELQAELREADRRARLLWRRVRTKTPPREKVRHRPPKSPKRLWPYAAAALPKYDGPVLDRTGHRGVFARFRYYSRRTARAGMSQRVLRYIYNGAAVDRAGAPYVRTNIAPTIEEALCALDHLEQVNWSAARNAKLLMHGILALDHRHTPVEMLEIGARWAEEALGCFDLPYVVALHAPPEDGDQRNWHAHVIWSYRPMIRVGDHEWNVGEMLRTDLDNPQAMKLMREMFAAVMTNASYEAGLNQVYTAKSNAARGLVHEPQVHLGAMLTNRARSGEYVGPNEENHERVMRSKAAVLDEELRHLEQKLVVEEQRLQTLTATWARSPAVPLPMPELVEAAPLDLSTLTELAPPSAPVPDLLAVTAVPSFIRPAKLDGWLPLALPILSLSAAIDEVEPLPSAPVQAVRPEFANLRIESVPPITPPLPSNAASLPPTPTRVATIGPPYADPLTIAVLDLASAEVSIPSDPLCRPIAPVLISPAETLRRQNLLRFAATADLERAIARADGALAREKVRAAQEAENKARLEAKTARAVKADAERRVALVKEAQRLVLNSTVRPYRHKDGRPVVDFSAFTMTERELIAAVGLDDPVLRQAFNDRLLADREVDRRAEQVLKALERERRWLRRDSGRSIVPPDVLERFGATAAGFVEPALRDWLNDIAHRNEGELSRIAAHVIAHPGQLHRSTEGWELNQEAPRDVADLLAKWRDDRQLQVALERTRSQSHVDGPAAAAPESDGWRRARELRAEFAYKARRMGSLGISDLPQPAAALSQPGQSDVAIDRAASRPAHGWLPGHALGD